MDLPRTSENRKRRRWLAAGGMMVVGVAAVALTQLAGLESTAFVIDRQNVWTGTVQRGDMLRQVRGSGRLVSEQARWIAAQTAGVVEIIELEAGARVVPDTLVLRLANPEVEQAAADAQNALARARAEQRHRQADLDSERLDREAALVALEAEHHQAALRAEADTELAAKGLLAEIIAKISRSSARALETRLGVEQRRLRMFEQAVAARLSSERAEVRRREALAALRRDQLSALEVRAGVAGIVQDIPVEAGQQVLPGTNLARVAAPHHLKAVLRVPATQTSDLRPGQPVDVDTRNGVIRGAVRRVEPTVRQGRVLVEVELMGELPPGARPDLTVNGAIEIEKLRDVLFVERPAYSGEAEETVMFRLEADNTHATRQRVRFGRASINTIEIAEGLVEGDRVILSDTSRFDDEKRVRLK